MMPFANAPKPFVLVVDSDFQRGRLLALRLRSEGCYSAAFAAGEEALTYAAVNEPDAVIADWRLSDMTGLDFARRLKAQSFPAKVILLNDQADWRMLRETLEGGGDELLKRPISTPYLLRILDRSLGVAPGAGPAPR